MNNDLNEQQKLARQRAHEALTGHRLKQAQKTDDGAKKPADKRVGHSSLTNPDSDEALAHQGEMMKKTEPVTQYSEPSLSEIEKRHNEEQRKAKAPHDWQWPTEEMNRGRKASLLPGNPERNPSRNAENQGHQKRNQIEAQKVETAGNNPSTTPIAEPKNVAASDKETPGAKPIKPTPSATTPTPPEQPQIEEQPTQQPQTQPKTEEVLPETKPETPKEAVREPAALKTQTEVRRKMPSIQTYGSDAREDIQKRDPSLSDIRNAELQKKKKEVPSQTEHSFSQMFILYTSLILLTAGLVALIVVGYLVFLAPEEKAEITTYQNLLVAQTSAPIYINERDREDVIAEIASEIVSASEQTSDEVAVFPVLQETGDSEQVSATQLMEIVGENAPNALTRNLNNEFVLGVLGAEKVPFIILTTSSYEQTYPAMLEWEANIAHDLAGIITPISFTGSTNSQDQTVENRDARVIYDSGENQVLVYMFVDTETIVIAPNTAALRQVIGAYRNAQRL
ncbi:MAG: hypothetical protein WDZ82_02710 [Candidatus Paceibacterota bacterium]